MKKKPIIISIKSLYLDNNEKTLLKTGKPWGIILFKRNIKSLSQIKKLVKNIRKYANDKKFPILIDEEGKSVSRLTNIIEHGFTQKFFGDLFNFNPILSLKIYENYIENLCKIFKIIGINLNTVPVLDVLTKILIK